MSLGCTLPTGIAYTVRESEVPGDIVHMSPQIQGYGHDARPTEGAILSKIETALENALGEEGLEPSTNPVKRQKYLYLAVDKFTQESQNPITYSWFKWGASAMAGPGGPDTGKTFFTDRPSAAPLIQTSIPEYTEFFLSDEHDLPLGRWWEADFLNFLEQFYEHSAPDRYQNLYLDNIQLLKIIDDVEGAIFRGRNPAREETYNEVCGISADVKGEILVHEEFEGDYEIVSEFMGLLEDMMMVLADISEDELEKGHQTAISELQDHYIEHVWLILAHNISLKTAVGPNTKYIYQTSPDQLTKLRQMFEKEHDTKKQICSSVNLLPSLVDYEGDSGTFEEKGAEFLSIAERRESEE